MNTIADLNSRFGIPGIVAIEAGNNDMPRVRITSPAAQGEIYLHGAHLTHFAPQGHKPVLFMSKSSLFDPAKPIRGGVPVIFPWFGPNSADPKAPQHGFARTATWTIRDVRVGMDAVATVSLSLGASELSRRYWQHDFNATYTVSVGKQLDMSLEVVNTSPAELTFEQALHTYLAVGDIRRTTIDGLAGRQFIDKADKGQRKTQSPGPFSITGETDRVYVDTPDTVTVNDHANSRRLIVSKSGSNSTVVWNPWINKARAMADFGDDEWPAMLCIETANAADNAVKLAPGERHTMTARVEVEA